MENLNDPFNGVKTTSYINEAYTEEVNKHPLKKNLTPLTYTIPYIPIDTMKKNLDYEVKNQTIPVFNLKDLKRATAACKEDRTNLKNLAHLKRLINLCHAKMNPVVSFFTKLLKIGIFGKANRLYDAIYDKLPSNQSKNVDNLVLSYSTNATVTELHLAEGVYTGPIIDGLPHGRGNLVSFAEKDQFYCYEGEFNYGKMEGKGVVIRPGIKSMCIAEERLIGLFEDNAFKAGSCEIGEFKKGRLKAGIREDEQNRRFEGVFHKTMLTLGKITYDDNSWQMGRFNKEGNLEGPGKMKKDGTKYEGNFINGELDGVIKCTHKGMVSYQVYERGQYQGLFDSFNI